MKARKKVLIPVALGLMVSACSTSSNQQSTSSSVPETVTSIPDAIPNTEDVYIDSSEASQANALKDTQLENAKLRENIASKDNAINSLEQQLSENQTQVMSLNREIDEQDSLLALLNQELDEKDALIASLQSSNSLSDAATLAALEEEKQRRNALENQYAALRLDNDLLTRRIDQLETENASLKQQIVQLEGANLDSAESSQDEFQQGYYNLLNENAELQEKYSKLAVDGQHDQQQITSLRNQNDTLREALIKAEGQEQALQQLALLKRQNATLASALSEARAQIASLQSTHQETKIELESALDESAAYEQRWKDLDNQLAQAQQQNVALSTQMNRAEAELTTSRSEVASLSTRLNRAEQALGEYQSNDTFLKKYGYWGLAILFSLLGGFFVGRIGKTKDTL